MSEPRPIFRAMFAAFYWRGGHWHTNHWASKLEYVESTSAGKRGRPGMMRPGDKRPAMLRPGNQRCMSDTVG